MRTNLTNAIILAGALAPSAAHADSKMEIGAFVGLHLWSDNNELGTPDSEMNDEIENGPIFGVRIARRLHSAISAEAELGLSPAVTEATDTDVVAIGYRLHVLVHPARFVDDRLEPFALIGIGGMTSASSDTAVLTNDSDFAMHGGLGFKYRIGRDWGIRFDARLLLPPANDGLITADGEFLLGVFKTFPPKPVAAKVTETTPPPLEQPKPIDGDGDGDGVADQHDTCPERAEDRDGFEDQDGCPDPDDDADGVPDAADRCQGQAETANSFQDDDGCPDEPPPAVKQFTGAIKGIDFATGSDKLAASSNRALDAAVKVLTDYPALRLEISGHTDSTGDATLNRDLSRRRAEAVKGYFVAHGIAAERLDAAGRGPDQPIADNTTAEGRAKNRRVEFKLR